MNYRQLSKTIAHALRHDPQRYGLTLDRGGWTDIDALLAALGRHRPGWQTLTRADLEAMMARADKQRYEIHGRRIRARYGHSVDEPVRHQQARPPHTLFHGTSPRAAAAILREGLQAMNRQYVHLSTERQTADAVGRRKAPRPTILAVRAAEAHRAGLPFYPAGDEVWLVEEVPPEFIDLADASAG